MKTHYKTMHTLKILSNNFYFNKSQLDQKLRDEGYLSVNLLAKPKQSGQQTSVGNNAFSIAAHNWQISSENHELAT
jgi:hypothetical protein